MDIADSEVGVVSDGWSDRGVSTVDSSNVLRCITCEDGINDDMAASHNSEVEVLSLPEMLVLLYSSRAQVLEGVHSWSP